MAARPLSFEFLGISCKASIRLGSLEQTPSKVNEIEGREIWERFPWRKNTLLPTCTIYSFLTVANYKYFADVT